ncbi:MAG TPA: aspartate aminotransferase family protein [Symbiobacteriaceae bacterium]|nr:aspartate aminotransferase family protein [Symbiobacteriaceae bacterium]
MSLQHILECHQVAPVEITHARGSRLYDPNGRSYVDFEAGIWCMALGYSHPRVQACLARQSGQVMHLGPMLTGAAVDAAAGALLRRTPYPEGKALFLSSGSEAVEMAMRLSRQITGRTRFLSLQKSYLGAYGLSGRDFADTRTEVDLTPCLTCSRAECTAACPNLEGVAVEEVAAFVWEPVLASGGILEPPAKLVRLLVSWVRSAGGLAVVDEVTTGLGRTAAWWGFEHTGVTPDLIACGKALGNGYPVSAVVVSPAVAEMVECSGFQYSQSHQNDPLAAAIAAEVLVSLEEEGLIEQAGRMGDLLGRHLLALQRRHRLVAGVRGRGLMWGMELQGVPVDAVWRRMIERGYLLGVKPPLSLLRFLPPLVISPDEIAGMSAALDEVLTQVDLSLA